MHMQGEVTPGGGGHRSKARHGANSAHREGYGRPRAWLDERDDDAGEGGGDEGGDGAPLASPAVSPAVSHLAATPRANASSDAAACGWLEALAVSLLCTGGRVSCCRAMCLM